jgi:GTPase
MTSTRNTRCGYCAILGAPNAGKSTLMNEIIGSKVSIVSRKVQTTRCRVNGIYSEDDTQIVFVDTPGLFEPKRPLERAMVDEVWQALYDVDVLLLLIDAAGSPLRPDFTQLDRIIDRKRPDQSLILALNKIDDVNPRSKLLELSAVYNAHYPFAATLMIAGQKGDGVAELIKTIGDFLPAGPFFYPEDQVTDIPLMLMSAEVTREQIFDRLHEELPYNIMVETEEFDESVKGEVTIRQNIIVSRDNHKGMVIGKGGATLKQIGSRARAELENIFEKRIHLFLRVAVDEKWQENAERLRRGGLLRG